MTIAIFDAFFAFLMSLTRGMSTHNLPDWWLDCINVYEHGTTSGDFIEVRLPAVVMLVMVLLTRLLIYRVSLGRLLFALGDNPDGASNACPNSTPCPPRAQRSSLVVRGSGGSTRVFAMM